MTDKEIIEAFAKNAEHICKLENERDLLTKELKEGVSLAVEYVEMLKRVKQEIQLTIELLTNIDHSPESAWNHWLFMRDSRVDRLKSLLKEIGEP